MVDIVNDLKIANQGQTGCVMTTQYTITIMVIGYHIRLWIFYQVPQVRAEVILHYGDVIMGAIASQITSLTIVYSTVYSDADQRKHQSTASLAFVRGIHRGPVNSPHKWPVTRKMFPFDDVIMCCWGLGCVSRQLASGGVRPAAVQC